MEADTFDVENEDANEGMTPGFVSSIYKTFDKDQKKYHRKLY